MRHEVHGLRDFYATPAGLVAARLLRDRLRRIWPRLPGQAVLGLGYASPFLRLWRPDVPGGAARCISLVPAHLPHWRWPRGDASRTAVGEGEALPFPDLSFDRILLVHGLEHAENARRLLREAWRVLKDDGRLLVVTPNRRGLWAHLERTPSAMASPIPPTSSSACCGGRCSPSSGGSRRSSCRPSRPACCCAAPWPGKGSALGWPRASPASP
ncbi:class I SAM-dependent methyltransferase [Paeniroseomonas aquatica]|uniref:class I SAM-dependent methyltransferase n=1 Tax=Paeniroseomonas aquatica TaxID=373043 RepID=UPI00362369CE